METLGEKDLSVLFGSFILEKSSPLVSYQNFTFSLD